MRQKREMSARQFQRRHPGIELVVEYRTDKTFSALAVKNGANYAQRTCKGVREAIHALSQACSRLAALDAMEAQRWKDANLGTTGVALDPHHLQKRSAGRLDSQANLVGVSRRVHDAQHGQVEFTKGSK